jgi:uncharacterized protein
MGEKFDHEIITRMIIDKEPDLSKKLGPLKESVLNVFTEDSISSDIISSSLDADKLDYLRRDSYHSGVSYGRFDFDRVIHTICRIIEPERDYRGISYKGIEALENYRLARYGMHLQVYEHHARIIADNMFLKAVKLALTDNTIDRGVLDISNTEFLQNYLGLDDYSIQHQILQSKNPEIISLMKNIRNRNLMKRALDIPLNKAGIPDAIKRQKVMQLDRSHIEQLEIEIADELGIDSSNIIVHLQNVKIKLYERFWEIVQKREKPIYIKEKDGSVTPFDEESPFSLSLGQINRLYVFCPTVYVDKIRPIAKQKLGV